MATFYFYKKKHFRKGNHWIRGKDDNIYEVKKGKWFFYRYGNLKKVIIGKLVTVKKDRELILGDAVKNYEKKPKMVDDGSSTQCIQ